MKTYTISTQQKFDWLCDRNASSPEDDWISALDGDDEDETLPPVPSLDGINEDLIWIWRCREASLKWADIASMMGYTNASGVWKKYHKLLKKQREKKPLS